MVILDCQGQVKMVRWWKKFLQHFVQNFKFKDMEPGIFVAIFTIAGVNNNAPLENIIIKTLRK